MNRIAKSALWGAIGFGIGGVVSGTTLLLPAPRFYFLLSGFFLLGAIGGSLLGWASGGWKKSWPLALAGAIGFGCGFILALFVSFEMSGKWDVGPLTEAQSFIFGAIIGAIGGASLGIALKNWRGIGLLAIAGAIGFGVPMQVTEGWQLLDVFKQVAIFAISGAISGACMGAALGYLEKRRVDRGHIS